MRNLLLASALSLAFAAPAFAQQWAHEPGTGQSGPASDKASNIDGSDSRSDIAPHFQSPSVGENAAPVGYLRAAETALVHHRTGEAQQALEMAETRLLDRSTPVSEANVPSQNDMVRQVSIARQALGHNDVPGARQAIAVAINDSSAVQGMGSPPAGTMMPYGAMHSTSTSTTSTGMQPGAAMAPGSMAPGTMAPGTMAPGTMAPGVAAPQ